MKGKGKKEGNLKAFCTVFGLVSYVFNFHLFIYFCIDWFFLYLFIAARDPTQDLLDPREPPVTSVYTDFKGGALFWPRPSRLFSQCSVLLGVGMACGNPPVRAHLKLRVSTSESEFPTCCLTLPHGFHNRFFKDWKSKNEWCHFLESPSSVPTG